MSMMLGDRIVGLKNNGFINCGDDTMMEVIKVNESTNKFDGKVIAKKGMSGWKKINGPLNYAMPVDRFRAATPEEISEAFPVKVTKAKIDEKYIFGSGFFVTKRIDGTMESNINYTKSTIRETNMDRIDAIDELITQYNKHKTTGDWSLVKEIRDDKYSPINEMFSEESMVALMDQLLKFFIEFKYTPSLRFVNTLARIVGGDGGVGAGVDYIVNYFKLSNSAYTDKVAEKLKSPEAKNILTQLTIFTPSDNNVVNRKLRIWFGSPGAGKTYDAMNLCENRCVVCNSGVLPDDLMQDFKFEDGKPAFEKSAFRDALENGKRICLDEFSLLPMDTIRFIQGILDNKTEFIYKGEVIKVKEGFEVIATMNLVVNGTVFGLTEPIIDRASELKEYAMTGKKLVSALL